jgi:hypothetical protein
MTAASAPMPAALFPDLAGHWLAVKDGDPRVAELYTRHYSYRPYKDNRRRVQRSMGFAGIGEKIVLLTATGDAAWVWRKFSGNPEMVAKYGWQTGIGCAFFRNEGPIRSSELIREAVEIAWRRWPGERLFTFVEDAKVATSQQHGRARAGWCYRKAGWRVCGRNKDGRLTILEILP